MKPTVMLAKHLELLIMISLLVSVGCATPSKQQPTTVGPHCSIAWDKMNDPKVTGYQLTVIDQNKQAKKQCGSSPQIQRRCPAATRAPAMKERGT